MENLDYLPQSKVLFRYDLKFSEVNRLHICNFSDVQIVFDYLSQTNPLSQELTLNGKATMSNINKTFDSEMDKTNKSALSPDLEDISNDSISKRSTKHQGRTFKSQHSFQFENNTLFRNFKKKINLQTNLNYAVSSSTDTCNNES